MQKSVLKLCLSLRFGKIVSENLDPRILQVLQCVIIDLQQISAV